MLDILWMIPTLPLAGFIVLICGGNRVSRSMAAVFGVGCVGISALLALSIGISFASAAPAGHAYTQTVAAWIVLGDFAPSITFYLDPLSLLMVLVITGVGFLIHLYSVEYMAGDEGFRRFFAYMNLFVAAMLILVLADNLALLYVGWEGVGLCSYLLIGFWYKEPANARAAVKAFVTTRVGDTAMIIGILLLFNSLETLQIQDLMEKASKEWVAGSTIAVLAAALLLGGALGKSAQLPLQTWLPDAMAGPTPVSALIHAATMVTAGVYLIARTHVLFSLAPVVQWAVAVIGVLTLLIAAFSAMTQSDIKRVLAYSTISQIGYMFLALGVGAWSAAMFHFMTHAFFKSLLFLAAGSVILSANHQQDMFRLGGLRRQLPVAFWTLTVGAASLSSLPLITDGFYSKDMILWYAWSSEKGSPWLWAGGVVGALLTGIYSFRMVFLTFFGEARTSVTHRPGALIAVPLIVLALLSVVAGFIELPHNLGDVRLFSRFMESVLPPVSTRGAVSDAELPLQLIAGAVSIAGIVVAYLMFVRFPRSAEVLAEGSWTSRVLGFWFAGWGFDRLYDALFVRPFVLLASVNRQDFVDFFYSGTAAVAESLHRGLSGTQTGRLRNYAFGIGAGTVAVVGILVFL